MLPSIYDPIANSSDFIDFSGQRYQPPPSLPSQFQASRPPRPPRPPQFATPPVPTASPHNQYPEFPQPPHFSRRFQPYPYPRLGQPPASSISSQDSPVLVPPFPTPQLPTPFPTTPLHTPTSLQPSPLRSAVHGMFYRAQNFTITNSRFAYNPSPLVESGLEKLLRHSMPDAFHDSAARYPPPKCHLGTRNEYITKIIDWAAEKSDHQEPILWMRGPFGVGKTAVAQSCAEALKSQNRLAATLFFSHSNKGRDDPRRVFTSIAYQIAVVSSPFRDIIDARVRDDPAITTKSLATQFEELLVYPLRQIDIPTSGVEGRVVVIDGLDECCGIPEQCEIVEIIADSVRNRTTPFRWLITSRPEDAIIQTMSSDSVLPVTFRLELPVSRDIDHEVLVYMTDEFEKIRKRHRLPDSWPSEEALALLVERTNGLWIYVTTIIRFVADENSFGPEDQLRIVLEFVNDVSAKAGSDNPLAEMDFFYALIMQRVPLKIRTTIRRMLLLLTRGWLLGEIADILGLSEEQLRHCCASIRSVLEVQGSEPKSMTFSFHHASFLDFMKDPKRSKELSIHGDFLIEYRRELLDWLQEVCSRSTDSEHIIFPSAFDLPEGCSPKDYYFLQCNSFWDLCTEVKHPLDVQTVASLGKLRFKTMLRLVQLPVEGGECSWGYKLSCILDNLPTELRDNVIRKDKCPTPRCTNTEGVWILGHGENEAVIECYVSDDKLLFWLANNQDPPGGKCPCGSPVLRRRGKKRTV